MINLMTILVNSILIIHHCEKLPREIQNRATGINMTDTHDTSLRKTTKSPSVGI